MFFQNPQSNFSPGGTRKKKSIQNIPIKSFWKSRNLFSKRFLAAGGKVDGKFRFLREEPDRRIIPAVKIPRKPETVCANDAMMQKSLKPGGRIILHNFVTYGYFLNCPVLPYYLLLK